MTFKFENKYYSDNIFTRSCHCFWNGHFEETGIVDFMVIITALFKYVIEM